MGGWDGLSYHGTSLHAPFRAVALGSYMVECHLQLDDTPSVLDAHSSLTVEEMLRLWDPITRWRVESAAMSNPIRSAREDAPIRPGL